MHVSGKAHARRKPFKEKWTTSSTDPQPLGELLKTWKAIAQRMRDYADQQGAKKDYEAAASNSVMAEMIEGCAAELEKSIALYTIEEVEGEPAEEPKSSRRKRLREEAAALVQESAQPPAISDQPAPQ